MYGQARATSVKVNELVRRGVLGALAADAPNQGLGVVAGIGSCHCEVHTPGLCSISRADITKENSFEKVEVQYVDCNFVSNGSMTLA